MGLMDIINGMQNGPGGQTAAPTASSGMSPLTMGLLALLAYKAFKGSGSPLGNIFGGNAISQILWAIGVTLIFQFGLVKTRWGMHTIATGGNLLGAAEVGVKTGVIKIGNFIICSVLGGLAGILDAFRIGSIDPLAGGTEIMFMAIASAVIGGTLLTGGSGTIVGALLGAIVLGILKDGFTLSGVSAYTFDMILGGAILITMLINVHLSRLRAAGGG